MTPPERAVAPRALAIRDGEKIPASSNGQEWVASWHPPREVPAGTPHGAAGVCVTAAGELVLISHDQRHWGFPAGRPDGDEPPEATLRRELLEEACATVLRARLLGFVRSQCVDGWQEGLVLVRSYWRAEVEVGPWEPRFEIRHRRLVPAAEALQHLSEPDPAATRISCRAMQEAGLLDRANGA